MRFSISRETLLPSLQMVSGVVERRQTLPILANLLIQAKENDLHLVGTDLEVQISTHVVADISLPSSVTIPAKKLLDICKNLPDKSDLRFDLDGSRCNIVCGRSRFSLTTLPAADFPTLDQVEWLFEVSVPQRELKSILEKTLFAMAQQDVRYFLNGLMIEFGESYIRSVAADGHRLALSEFAFATGIAEMQQIIVPRKGVIELSKLLNNSDSDARLSVSSNHLRVVIDSVEFTTKLLDGRFPEYKRVIPEQTKSHLTVAKDSLRQALVRAAILCSDKYRGVKMIGGSNNLLQIQSQNPEQDEADEQLEIVFNGPDVETGFNVNYLIDAIGVLKGDEITLSFSDNTSSCLVESKDDVLSKMVVMPMRF